MRLRTLAWLLALGMLVPVSIAGVAGADHDNSDLAQFCPRDHVEARNAKVQRSPVAPQTANDDA
jgi:hypothetical protein